MESQERDIKLLRDGYERESQTLREQINSMAKKIAMIEASKNEELDNMKRKCLSATNE